MSNRTYSLPERLPGESNSEWCERAAASIPAEELMRQLIYFLKKREKQRKQVAWGFISDMTTHGSGVSNAIVNRFSGDPE